VSVRASVIDKCSNPREKENSRVSEVGSPHIDFTNQLLNIKVRKR